MLCRMVSLLSFLRSEVLLSEVLFLSGLWLYRCSDVYILQVVCKEAAKGRSSSSYMHTLLGVDITLSAAHFYMF